MTRNLYIEAERRGYFVMQTEMKHSACLLFVASSVECMCCLLSQNLRWVLSREHSAAADVSARILMIFQKTAIFHVIMTCYQFEIAPHPLWRRSAVNDSKSWCVAQWDSQGAKWHGCASSSSSPSYLAPNLSSRQLLYIKQNLNMRFVLCM